MSRKATVLQDGSICSFDLRENKLVQRLKVADADAAVPSFALHPTDANTLFCCYDTSVSTIDRRQVGYILQNSERNAR